MKKVILTSFSILCLSFITIALKYGASANAAALVIKVPDDYATIQEAINAANPGDTILVSNGTYYENIVVDKGLSIIGEGPDGTIIDGKEVGSVVTVTASDVVIRGFTIQNGSLSPVGYGVNVERAVGVVISGNVVIYNKYGGIRLLYSDANVVSDNIVHSNGYSGIYLVFSHSNLVSGNAVYLNDYIGIDASSSNDNVFVNNNVFANYWYGISLTLGQNNRIYHNNFDNLLQANAPFVKNLWDYEGEGNYWSSYNGTDLVHGAFRNETGSDGVGDTEYVIDVNNKDNYPLMGRFYAFNVTLRTETHWVNIISSSTISGFAFEFGEETGNKVVRFRATSQNGNSGFCRVDLPTELMGGPFVVLVNEEEVTPSTNGLPEGLYSYLYFTFMSNDKTITIISSKTLLFYYELLGKNTELQNDLDAMNATYSDILSQYNALSGNYSQLQNSYQELSSSFQEYLRRDAEKSDNIRSLTYIITATTAVFIVTTVYLSRSAQPQAPSMS